MSIAYIDTRMPQKMVAGFRFSPDWNTSIDDMANGAEKRQSGWMYPRWRGQGQLVAADDDECKEFLDMMMATRGKWAAFRVRIPRKFAWKATKEPLVVEAGTKEPAQLITRHYFPGSTSAYADSRIQAPVSGSVTVMHRATSGDPWSPVAGTLDAGFGLFTPTSNWASGEHAWDGKYDRWMRFQADWNPLVAEADKILTADIELIEVRRGPAA